MSTGSISPRADRRLAIIAGVSVGLSVVVVIVRAFGVLPSALATAIVLVGVVVALRVLMLYSARSATAAGRARVLMLVSTAGIAISGVTVVASLPHLTATGGMGTFVGDLGTHLWALALLTIAVGPARTFGWRILVGTGLAGFLAVPSLARYIGTPVVTHFGTSSMFATAVYVPATEEILKALPVLLVAFFAVRRLANRPSALDLALLGAWSGTGFALYEDALYGRGGAQWSADPPFSLLLPTERSASLASTSYIAGGHLVYTALLGLGIGVAVLYRRRFRWAWVAAPVAALVAFGEHLCANSLPLVDAKGDEPLVERILSPLTLGGRLSTLLLVAGVVVFAVVERRAVGRTPLPAWFVVRPPEAARRTAALAAAQSSRKPARHAPRAAQPGSFAPPSTGVSR
jgi:RsiW-degrading membrane proteinase PrsW (M82 family)